MRALICFADQGPFFVPHGVRPDLAWAAATDLARIVSARTPHSARAWAVPAWAVSRARSCANLADFPRVSCACPTYRHLEPPETRDSGGSFHLLSPRSPPRAIGGGNDAQ